MFIFFSVTRSPEKNAMPPTASFCCVARNLLGEPIAVFRCLGERGEESLFALGLARLGIKIADYQLHPKAWGKEAALALKEGYQGLIKVYKEQRLETPVRSLPFFDQTLRCLCPVMS